MNKPKIASLASGLITATLLLVHPVALAGDETPTTLNGGKVITVEEGKKLLDSKSALFIDTRAVLNFGKGHVPGAITASYKENSEKNEKFDSSKDQFDSSKLPAEKTKPVVFYSDGPSGWKSYKAAVIAIKEGHKNVMYMRGGYADWLAKNFPTEN